MAYTKEVVDWDYLIKWDIAQSYKNIIPNHIYEEIENFYYKDTLPKTITLSHRIRSKIIKSNSQI
ncbi:hypothetical protein C1645_813034 [Glomus cerebriforme]|uniref:Uncharacterized protein n=1 Tax=Glomus cerebriforme TaxID=658196 RepID=A0A397TIX8_9GLOM|nr:hypothetical protein C1645_813034 [Glomus cerebriforme]